MYFLFKMGIFHSYVCLPEGTSPGMILQVRDQPAFWLFLHFLCQASIAMFSWPGDTQSRWSGGFFLLSDIFGSTPKIWAQAPSRLYVWLSFTLRSLKNGWLGDDCFLCGMAKFQGLCYSFREGIQFDMFFFELWVCGRGPGKCDAYTAYTYSRKKEPSDCSFPKLGGFSWFSMCQWEARSIANQHDCWFDVHSKDGFSSLLPMYGIFTHIYQ